MSKGSLLRGAGIIGISLGIIQVFGYLLNVVGARVLGHDAFGAFGALQNVVVIGNVLALGIQAVVARLVVQAAESDRGRVGSRTWRFTLIAASLLTAAGLLAAPALTVLLRQDGFMPTVMTAVLLFPLTLAGWQYGMAQGRERYGALGVVVVANGLGRFLGGIVGLLVVGTVTGAMVAMCIGTWVGAGLGQFATYTMASGTPLAVPVTRQVITASHAMLALYVATSIDLLLARYFLSGVESGEYALGAVIAKVTYWLPSFVAIVAFPRMAQSRNARTTLLAAAAVCGIGAMLVIGTALAAKPIVVIMGGQAYLSSVGNLWMFALIGAAFSLAQLLVYSRLATADRGAATWLWVAVAVIVLGVWRWHSSVAQVAAIVFSTALALAVAGIVRVLIVHRRNRL